MKLFKIKYHLLNNVTMTVGILANNREESIEYLKKHQKNIRTIESIFIGDDIHVIVDNIVETYINKTDRVKKLKEDIQYLKNCLTESDEIIEKLQTNPIESPVNVNEIEMLHEKIIQLEQEKIELKENSSTDLNLSNKIKELEKQLENTEKVYICPECLKEFKSAVGVKQHYTKTHKE